MIDEKGRLFGKVNLIDLIIVIIIIAALAFLGVKFLGPESTAANTQKAVVSFYYEECPNYVADQLKAGDSVWDSGDNVTIGTVKDWTNGGLGYLPSGRQWEHRSDFQRRILRAHSPV